MPLVGSFGKIRHQHFPIFNLKYCILYNPEWSSAKRIVFFNFVLKHHIVLSTI